jgi:hypothetical protein
MNGDRLSRLLLWCGPGSIAALVIAASMSRPLGNLPAPERISRQMTEQRIPALLGTYVQTVASFLLLAFSAGLWSRLRAGETGAAPLSTLALAGGTVTGALMLGSAAAVGAATERAGRPGSGTETSVYAVDLSNMLMGKAAPVSMAAMTGATALVAHRSGIFPAWLTAASGGLTIGLLSPVNFVFVVVGALWIALVGAVLGRDRGGGQR